MHPLSLITTSSVFCLSVCAQGQFRSGELLVSGTVTRVAPVDIDGDGDIDLLLLDAPLIQLAENDGSGSFQVSTLSATAGIGEFGVGDFLRGSAHVVGLEWFQTECLSDHRHSVLNCKWVGAGSFPGSQAGFPPSESPVD